MPIDPVKIPQNVYIEDRIVGPLTLRQVLIVALGCGFSYAIWSTISKASGGGVGLPITILAWTPGALSVFFAFFKINDLSLLQILLLTIERMNKPSIRKFAPRRGISINIKTYAQASTQKEHKKFAAKEQPTQLEELSQALDQQSVSSTESAERMEEETSTLPQRPVDPSRVQATPMENVHARSSIFHDIVPKAS